MWIKYDTLPQVDQENEYGQGYGYVSGSLTALNYGYGNGNLTALNYGYINFWKSKSWRKFLWISWHTRTTWSPNQQILTLNLSQYLKVRDTCFHPSVVWEVLHSTLTLTWSTVCSIKLRLPELPPPKLYLNITEWHELGFSIHLSMYSCARLLEPCKQSINRFTCNTGSDSIARVLRRFHSSVTLKLQDFQSMRQQPAILQCMDYMEISKLGTSNRIFVEKPLAMKIIINILTGVSLSANTKPPEPPAPALGCLLESKPPASRNLNPELCMR